LPGLPFLLTFQIRNCGADLNRLYNTRPLPKPHGFSLVELVIVIVVISLLAAVAVPIYHQSIKRAIRAEAESTLGSIRTQVIAYYGEHGFFPIEPVNQIMNQNWHHILPHELDGHYFLESSYYYQSDDGIHYLIWVHHGNLLPQHRSLNEKGIFEDWYGMESSNNPE